VGKLADGNAEEAKRARWIEQLTNFTLTLFHVEHAEHSASGSAIQAAFSPKLIIDGTEPWFEAPVILPRAT
jgi:hypothetical protein